VLVLLALGAVCWTGSMVVMAVRVFGKWWG
jgi:hypothetical protein